MGRDRKMIKGFGWFYSDRVNIEREDRNEDKNLWFI